MNDCEILIAGYGVSGKAAARLAGFLGKSFCVLDEKPLPELENALAPWDAAQPLPCRFKTAVLSPGIRAGNPLLAQIEKASGRVIGELEFAAEATDCPLIGITGTNGKTTTTELTTALFQAAGEAAESAGNIGAGLSDGVISYQQGAVSRLIVEISSFQLERAESFPVEVAAVLNLASDHVDRHGSMDEYARIKFVLANSAEKAVVLNANLIRERELFLKTDTPVITFSAYRCDADLTLKDDWICWREKPVFDYSTALLKGRHNAENMMAALALLIAVKGGETVTDPRITEALRNFAPDHHRVDCFLEKNGIRYVDDSKATNPHAVNAALEMFKGDVPNIRLLLGGLDKDMAFKELIPYLKSVKKIYLAGECRTKVAAALQGFGCMEDCGDFRSAARKMCAEAVPGDVVLLSPATASMDEFKNYKERGNCFKEIAKEIAGG